MKVSPATTVTTITAKTTNKKDVVAQFDWWNAESKDKRGEQLLASANYLKENQNFRYRQAAIYARLYGNQTLFNFSGSGTGHLGGDKGLPTDRPTFNIISSAVDTLVSRVTQSRPQPVFLTDNSDYKERNLAKKLNSFILGEFYQTKTYEKAAQIFRDALVEGTGCLKIYETPDNKVGLERKLLTELLVDPNESIYGDPRQLYEVKLVDRAVLMATFPEYKARISRAEQAYVDSSAETSKTVSDLVMVVEGWRLPSSPKAKDGRHTIACSDGTLFDEEWTKDKFPFVFMHYSKRLLGFWAQGLAERLMGTQMEINSLLYTISKAIKLVGVPRVFVEQGSKVSKASFNNDVGTLITYTGTKPIYEVAPCNAPELYEQLQRLITYGYQQEGISALDASSQKPAGLNSGEAIRTYDDISTDRMASTSRDYDNLFIDIAYQIIDLAKDICERDGSYQTVYPAKNSTQEVDLPAAKLLKNPFVIQCFNQSSLPRDPAGRKATVTEMIQSGMISLKEGRRLLDFQDLSQVETLAIAAEERVFKQLDQIIEYDEEDPEFEEEDAYSPPDPFTDLDFAKQTVVQYINLYAAANLEEEKMQRLRDYYTQVLALMQAANPPPQPAAAPGMDPSGGGSPAPAGQPGQAAPVAAPQAVAQSPLVPNGNPAGAQ